MADTNTHVSKGFRTIIFPTDGTKSNLDAARGAIHFCKTCNAKIIIVYVIKIDEETATQAHATSSAKLREIKESLNRLSTIAEENGINHQTLIKESFQPDKAIVDLAYQYNADIIIMGCHGRQGLLKILIGSMTSKILNRGFPIVMIVPGGSITEEKILLATDGSDVSLKAADEALRMSSHCSKINEMYILSVAVNEGDMEKSTQIVENQCKLLEEASPNLTCTPLVLQGVPADVIVSAAKDKMVDMIFIGGHGKGLSKLLLGHVTEKVIDQAPCAVVVVEKEK